MSLKKDDEFYVGYMPQAPTGMGRFTKKVAVLLVLAASLLGVLLVSQQGRLGPASFEFGNYREFEGWILEKPYPMIRLSRPGDAGNQAGHSLYFLVVFGKYGAGDAVQGLHGKKVRLQGALIFRDNQTMVELKDGSIEVLEEGSPMPDRRDYGSATLVGEIVDSKCFLGVMNPGDLKTHKACAINCIRGGIPPVLLVRNSSGEARYFLLTDESGGMVNDRVLDKIAVPVEIKGQVSSLDSSLLLKADPASYRVLE